jgi:hypothetical protein
MDTLVESKTDETCNIHNDISNHNESYKCFSKKTTCSIIACDKTIYCGILCYEHTIIHNKLDESQTRKLCKDYKNIKCKYC